MVPVDNSQFDEEDDSDEYYDEMGGGGMMMWDDDEQYIPVQEPVRPITPVNNVFADEQRNSLVFSTEDLKAQYERLGKVSKEFTH